MKGLRTYRVFVSPGGPSDDLKADGWKDIRALSPSDAALRAITWGLSETACAWVYVGLGEMRHPSGIPLCVRGFELRGKGARHLTGEGRTR